MVQLPSKCLLRHGTARTATGPVRLAMLASAQVAHVAHATRILTGTETSPMRPPTTTLSPDPSAPTLTARAVTQASHRTTLQVLPRVTTSTLRQCLDSLASPTETIGSLWPVDLAARRLFKKETR